jgi:kynurenine formamidase
VPALSETDLLGFFDKLSNWGRWGPGDELGTLNLIDTQQVRRAAERVSSGETISCARTIGPSARTAHPPMHFMISSGEGAPESSYGFAEDWIGMAFHGFTVTHLDCPSHVFWCRQMYGGRPSNLVSTARGAAACSVEVAAAYGIVSTGVLLDVPRALDTTWLEPGHAITPAELEACEQAQGVQAATGDILLIRTGRDVRAAEFPTWDLSTDGAPGLHASCLPWLRERGIAVLGSDAVNDVRPSGFDALVGPIHAVGIVAMGLWLIDNAHFEELARACAVRQSWAFMLCIAPLKLQRATGSPVNPIALL